MSNPPAVEFQRLRYWQGQKLRSTDFRDQTAIAAQLRWWHNRALHNAFGVARGFEIDVDEQERSVTIHPGVAYDCFGRELWLQTSRTISFPTVNLSVERTLLVQYRENADQPQREHIEKVCLPGKNSLFLEAPNFFWKPSVEVTPKDGVPLGRGYVSFAKPALVFIFTKTRVPVRAMTRPRIASGVTIAGNTPWKRWPEGTQALGFEVKIDTSSAGFTEAPCYFAWLQGNLWELTDKCMQLNDDLKKFIPAFFGHVHIDAKSDPTLGFTFRLWMPSLSFGISGNDTANIDIEKNFPTFAQCQNLFVCWLGIQPNTSGA